MNRSHTCTTTLSLSLGGDEPVWEGEATVFYTVTAGCPARTYGAPENCHPEAPDEIDGITVTHIDGQPVDAASRRDAETLEAHIECSGRLMDDLLTYAYEEAAERAENNWSEPDDK